MPDRNPELHESADEAPASPDTNGKVAQSKRLFHEAHLAAILEISEDAIISMDGHQRIRLFNRGAERIFGYAQDEVLGQPLDILLPSRAVDVHRQHIRAFAGPPEVSRRMGERREIVGRRKDGTEFPAEASISKLTVRGETVYTEILRDITQRKHAEEALLVKTGQLQIITETMLAFLETEGWRDASARLLRAALEQTASEYGFIGVVVDGPVLRILVHEGIVWDAAINRAFYDKAVQTYRERGYLEFRNFDNLFGRVITTGQTVLSNAPGSDPRSGGLPPGHPPLRHFLGVPLLHGQEVVGMIGVANRPGGYTDNEQAQLVVLTQAAALFYDSYRRRQREAQLEEQLRQSQKMEAVGQLAGGIAHDFNNMLTVITGHSELLLQQGDLHESLRGPLAEIQKAGERAGMLTNQLLAFSRQQTLHPTVLDLNTVVGDAATMLQRLIGEDIAIEIIPAQHLGLVKADQGQLGQVLINLAINACDAMPQGGRLTIETANIQIDPADAVRHPGMQPGSHVMVTVHDTGCGMDAETQAHVFEPFFTTKEKGKGTGLGLSTVYGIVKQSGGHIRVASEPGRGTTFTIYLPRVEAEALTPAASPEAKPADRGTETILLVEDEDTVLEVARDTLEEYGYTVLAACNGQEALLFSERHEGPIHLLLADVVMPGYSGREVAERLLAHCPDMKVLFMSGYMRDTIARHGVLVPGIILLEKPFRPETLARKVREVLDRRA
jgi:PAS domain S-box-containing protein